MDVNLIESFFAAYRKKEEQLAGERFNSETNAFLELKEKFAPVQTSANDIKATQAPYFNVFDILKIRHYEEKVHTPFLRHLLTPTETHEQGFLFLDSFFTNVLKLPYQSDDISHLSIFEEYVILDGRIDLLLLYRYRNQLKAIIIENKIYAGDQHIQLLRYYRFIKEQLRLTKDDFQLVYLTPHRHSPSDRSLKEFNKEQIRKNNINTVPIQEVKLKGYYADILPWLTDCLPLIRSEQVRFLVVQYIQTIRTL